MESICTRSRISQEFSASITPQRNGVVEKKNKVIQEMARSMLHNKDVPSTLFVIRLIGCILDPIPRRLHMSYGREGSQMLSISEFLEVLDSFSRIERMWENLTPEVMKEYF